MDRLGAYRNDADLPAIVPSVCTYLDVLGFRIAVREAAAAGLSNELLQRFHHVAANWFTSLGDIYAVESKEPRARELRVFTDNVVVGEPMLTDSALSFALSDLALLQLGLALDGFFVRGAVSVGELYIDEQVIFGEAILDAYESEQAAVNPRLVLHPTARAVVTRELQYYFANYHERKGHRFTDSLLVDEDGEWFVDYLQAIFMA